MEIIASKPTITRKELEKVLDCLIKDELTSGDTVKNFETSLANLVQKKYAVATNSLTSAYHLAYQALGINNEESEVIIPSFMSSAPLNALKIAGGKPVLIDNEKNAFTPSTDLIKEKVTSKTKALVIHHPFGSFFDYQEIKDLDLPIIEDISEAIGTEIDFNPTGSRGNITVASFAPSMIITTGNGGMILTNNSSYFSTIKELSGLISGKLNYEYQITSLQAAMGFSQLSRIKAFLKRRREIAQAFNEALKTTPHKTVVPYNQNFAYQSFPILFEAPSDKIEKFWKNSKVEITKSLENPLHTLLSFPGEGFPNADRLSKKLYSLPLYPTLTKKEIEKLSNLLASFI